MSNESKHMPLRRTDDYEIRGNDGTVIAKIYTFQNDATGYHKLPTRQESDFYANLFKDAPETAAERDRLKELNGELLELLKELNYTFYVKNSTKAMREVMAKTKPLIAKAEGRVIPDNGRA